MTNPIERLTASVPTWGAKLAYGDTTTVGGQEIVPVALVIFGFGGGEGSGERPEGEGTPAGKGEGSGGGGGGYALPVGAYVGSAGEARFQPNPVALAIVAVPLISAVGWAIARIVAATAKR